MCLAIPAKIVKIIDDKQVLADFGGVEREVILGLLGEPVTVGDYVLVHTGFAVAKVEEKEALETLEMWKEIESYSEVEMRE
ncbi:MAG: HypC/HybG/HupF family hydrogenase formation chaperone [Candidatus Hodarchaeales archaeon]|jgi:hydrogenase expression/formation protein HypC